MKKGDNIFVYGTLRKGQRADLSKSQSAFSVEFLGKDAINGLLYHLGSYPGVKLISGLDTSAFFADQPVVVGEIFDIKDGSVCGILDAYESYPYLYDREQVVTQGGRLAWVYTFNGPVIEDQHIETGDWQNPRLSSHRHLPPVVTVGRRK